MEIFEEEALESARVIDSKIKQRSAGSLAGLVFSVKDLISIKGKNITGGSKILQGYKATYNSTVVERLLAEDAILIGTTNCDEFGMGSSNENSYYGPVKNDADSSKVPGGSSGGSAVSVQEGSCHIAIGSDTGGSVRQPASFCGLYGLKPTYSRISRYGLLAYASSFDTIGVIGNTIEDIQLVYEVIAGNDPNDATSSTETVNNIPAENPLRFAYFKQHIDSAGIQPDILNSFKATIDVLRKNGCKVEEVDYPNIEYALPAYYILTTAEASSNLSRYDGLRYGMGEQAAKASSLNDSYQKTRSLGFGEEVKRRIFLGTFVLSASYYDAYYTKAQKIRTLLRNDTSEILKSADIILSPVTPTTAFPLGSHTKDPLEMYLSDLYTVHASVCGLPALSVPCGKDRDGMPYGIQAVSQDFGEQKLFQFSKYMQTLVK